MIRSLQILALIFLGLPFSVIGQTNQPASQNLDTKSPQLLGACFAQVPEVLSAHVPTVTKGKGLVVESIDRNSLAKKIGLRRHDILVRCGPAPVEDVKHLAGLLWATPPGCECTFGIVRSGQPKELSYTLKQTDLSSIPKSFIKPTGPPAVNLEVEQLSKEKMKITFTYYAGGSSKLQTLTCVGSVEEIGSQVKRLNQKKQLPQQIQELIGVALERIRSTSQ